MFSWCITISLTQMVKLTRAMPQDGALHARCNYFSSHQPSSLFSANQRTLATPYAYSSLVYASHSAPQVNGITISCIIGLIWEWALSSLEFYSTSLESTAFSQRTRQNTWRPKSFFWSPYISTTLRITNREKVSSITLALENQHGSRLFSHSLCSDVYSNQSKSLLKWDSHLSSGFGTKFPMLNTWRTISSLQ